MRLTKAVALLMAALAAHRLLLAQESVIDTPHNLSVSGPGALRASSEDEICIFCHTPHNASPQAPLWNRADPGATYQTYSSSTLKVVPGQPSGASRLCLSCHDGTIALGSVLSRPTPIAMAGAQELPPGRSHIGVDLSDDHPTSFPYQDALDSGGTELRLVPTAGDASLLDGAGQLQCTSCHDPHDNSLGDFLRLDPAGGGLCMACHDPTDWGQSAHATSGRTWDGLGPDPWPYSDETTVSQNACANCHLSHGAPGAARLLRAAEEEGVCLDCHNGHVSRSDIASELDKWSAHDPRLTVGAHDAAEVPDGTRTHVECVDCHNPHRTRAGAGGPTGPPGALRGVSGLTGSGAFVEVASHEYEVCYKCHADSLDSNPDRIPRQAAEASILRLFDPSNPSFHPVEAPGINPDVPSLKSPWTATSIMTCSDCHGNDALAGPRGPHGSRWDFLLRDQYETISPTVESATTYALCYRCHDRNSIRSDNSFREHSKHIEEDSSCSVCHAPHGIDAAQGNATNHSHLINFDLRYVEPSSNGRLEFVDTGRFSGRCSLTCHGEDHRDESYGG